MKTSELITEIIDKIKSNTKRLITGDILQNILNKILQKSDITFGENRPIIRFEQDEDGYRYLILQELYEDTIGIITDDIRNGSILYYSTDDNSINAKATYYGTNIYSGIMSDDGEYEGYIYLNTISNNRYDYGKISVYGKDKINNQKKEKIILRGDEDYGVKLNTGILFGDNNNAPKIKYNNGSFLISYYDFTIGIDSEFYIENSDGRFIYNSGTNIAIGQQSMDRDLDLYGDNIGINGYNFAHLDTSQNSTNKLVLNAGTINSSRLKTTYITSDTDVRIVDENDNIYVNFDIDDYEIYIGNDNIGYIDLGSRYNVHVRLASVNNKGNLELNVADTNIINMYEDTIDFSIGSGRMSWNYNTCTILNNYIEANLTTHVKKDTLNNKGILLKNSTTFYKPIELDYIEEPANEYEENGWLVLGYGGENYFATDANYNPDKIFKVLNMAGEPFSNLFGHELSPDERVIFVNANGTDTDTNIIFMMDRSKDGNPNNAYDYFIYVLAKYNAA